MDIHPSTEEGKLNINESSHLIQTPRGAKENNVKLLKGYDYDTESLADIRLAQKRGDDSSGISSRISNLYDKVPREEVLKMVKHPHQFPGWGNVKKFYDERALETGTLSAQEFHDDDIADVEVLEGKDPDQMKCKLSSITQCGNQHLPAFMPSPIRFAWDWFMGLDATGKERHKLGQWRATSIAGNDITSSCLYTAGICTLSAGVMAPISLFLVVCLLFFFRSIYSEVGTALPLNGGTYTVLLNTTSKLVAAIAACLTLLSYIATAVVSAASAAAYLQSLNKFFDPLYVTIIILFIFMVLALIGIGESATVALLIFSFHIFSMTLLIVCCIYALTIIGWDILVDNWQNPPPVPGSPNIAAQIYFGFSAALLGVSGFESSANYIEEQRRGVFPKTLRNMWMIVAFFNPVLGFLSQCVLPVTCIMCLSGTCTLNNVTGVECSGFANSLLAEMGTSISSEIGGSWLGYLISIDAAIVLSGAVLTGYVGVTGLAKRMALDRCLPQFFVYENKWRHTPHFIIIGFFLVTSSLYLVVGGNIEDLSGVYSIAFLSVMSLFAIGNILLKYKRDDLPRSVRAWWSTVVFGLAGVVAGLVGEIVHDPTYLAYFAAYFAVVLGLVMLMFARTFILSVVFNFLIKIPKMPVSVTKYLTNKIDEFNNQSIVFFIKNGELHILNKAVLYIRSNEQSNDIKFVHCYTNESDIPEKLVEHIEVLDECYPKIKLDLVLWHGEFNPRTVKKISKKLKIPLNFMFMAVPDDRFPLEIADFGGLRLITAGK